MDSDLNIYKQNNKKKRLKEDFLIIGTQETVPKILRHLSYSPLPVNKVLGDLFEDITIVTNIPN